MSPACPICQDPRIDRINVGARDHRPLGLMAWQFRVDRVPLNREDLSRHMVECLGMSIDDPSPNGKSLVVSTTPLIESEDTLEETVEVGLRLIREMMPRMRQGLRLCAGDDAALDDIRSMLQESWQECVIQTRATAEI